MFTFTWTLSDNMETRLQRLVDRTNKTEVPPLTLEDWLALHIREMAVQEDLSAAIPGIQADHQAAAEAALAEAIAARRLELMDGL